VLGTDAPRTRIYYSNEPLFLNNLIGEENEVADPDTLNLLNVDLEKQQLTSPNWPQNYPYDTDRFYCLTATSGRRVNLDFRWMDLETNCGMSDCDYVKV
jgi:hypothetical protein